MVFSSLVFLFAYLPAVLILYFLTPRRFRNATLLAVSLLFYAWGEPIYLFLMLASTLSAYLLGFPIAKYRIVNRERAKRFVWISVGINLSFLFFFKYYNFFASVIGLPRVEGLSLPIGISFYTFQIISYTLDLWRGDAERQRDPVAFGTYVTLFPQLIAGPIVRYREIDRQLSSRSESVDGFAEGVRRFTAGLAKKILLGDALAAGHEYYKSMMTLQPTALGAWLTIIFYTLHLYYDFSGYSDMAIGLGRMFGFSFPENFNYPYISKSITEFWRRWHMTLSLWFREYVYIPLGGNRRGRWRTLRNLLITWTLTGLWHGASWNFLLWGLYFFFLLFLEKFVLGRFLSKLPACLGHAYALFFILVGWLIFASDGESAIGGASFALRLVGGGGAALSDGWILYELRRNLLFLIILAVGSTPLPKQIFTRVFEKRQTVGRLLRGVLCLLSLVFSTAYLVDSGYNPFLYFRF